MLDTILTSPFFGLTLSAAAWCAGVWLQKKTGWVLCNPLVIAGVLIIALLAVFDIPLDHYNQGASMIQMILGPVTAVLALNIYQQRSVLKAWWVRCSPRCSPSGSASRTRCPRGWPLGPAATRWAPLRPWRSARSRGP